MAETEDVVEAPIEAVAVVEVRSTAHTTQSPAVKRKRDVILAVATSVDDIDSGLHHETVQPLSP